MSMNSPHIPITTNSALTPEQAAQAAEDRADDRDTSSGGWVRERQSNPVIPTPRTSHPVGSVRGFSDGERQELGDGTWPGEEDSEIGRTRLDEVRQVLADTSRRVGARVVTAAQLVEEQTSRDDEPVDTRVLRRELAAKAKELAISTGITHTVTEDVHGKLVVRAVNSRR